MISLVCMTGVIVVGLAFGYGCAVRLARADAVDPAVWLSGGLAIRRSGYPAVGGPFVRPSGGPAVRASGQARVLPGSAAGLDPAWWGASRSVHASRLAGREREAWTRTRVIGPPLLHTSQRYRQRGARRGHPAPKRVRERSGRRLTQPPLEFFPVLFGGFRRCSASGW